MKDLNLKSVIYIAIMLVFLLYFGYSFVELEFDVRLWGVERREHLVGVIMLSILMLGGAYYITKSIKKG